MVGRQVILINKPLTLQELEQIMQNDWDKEQYGNFKIGRPTKASIEEYILLYCTEGGGTILLSGGETVHLTEGEAFCIPSGTGHRYYADPADPWSILWVHFNGTDTSFYPLDLKQTIHLNSSYATQRLMFLFELLFRVLFVWL